MTTRKTHYALQYYGDMNASGNAYIKFDSDFFDNYKSVTVRFRASGNEKDVTFTADGVDADNQDMFTKDDANDYAYFFNHNGGGHATIIQLLQWRVWID